MNQRFVASFIAVIAVACGGTPPGPAPCRTEVDCGPDERCVAEVCVPKDACVPTSEICNQVDDDCDGQVDDGVCTDAGMVVVVPDGGTDGGGVVVVVPDGGTDGGGVVVVVPDGGTDGGGTVADPDGGTDGGSVVVPDGGPSCVPATEVCDGADNDCDGLVDEGVTISCVDDADGDSFATSLAPLDRCYDASRPQAGFCPPGTTRLSLSQGIDCNPNSALAFRLVSTRADADQDFSCVGAPTMQCVGTLIPAGRRGTSSCAAIDDCEDSDATRWILMELAVDADADQRCSGGPSVMRCIGDTAPAGTRFFNNCFTQSDCDDANPNIFRSWMVRPDGDNDGFCFGPITSQCGNNAGVMGFRSPQTCNAVDDCRDTNPLAGAQCVLTGAYTTSFATKTCALVAPTQSFTVSATNICPLGFVLGSFVANKTAGNGSCTATSQLTLSMTCNGLDGATCNIVGSCVAL